MPVALPETPQSPAPSYPRRKRWTRTECATLASTGLWDGQKLELIEGELIDKMGKKQPHVYGAARMLRWLMKVFAADLVFPEAPIGVAPGDEPINEPEPDVIVLNRTSTDFQRSQPQPADLALVVEVADTSLNFDLTVKARVYARAGIVDYWVLDLNGRRMIVHRDPKGGRYKSITAYGENERVAPVAAPAHELRIGDVLG